MIEEERIDLLQRARGVAILIYFLKHVGNFSQIASLFDATLHRICAEAKSSLSFRVEMNRATWVANRAAHLFQTQN